MPTASCSAGPIGRVNLPPVPPHNDFVAAGGKTRSPKAEGRLGTATLKPVLFELLRHEAPMFGQQPVLLPDAFVPCLLGLPVAFRGPSPIVVAQMLHEESTADLSCRFAD